MSSDSMSMVTGVMHAGGLTMSPPAVDGLQMMSEEDKFHERKRDILVLVMRFLADYGFVTTYQTLCAEAATSLDQADAADNIDLMTIVQEFVDYYHSRFGRYPKLVRRSYLPPAAFQMQQMAPAAMQQAQALQLQAAVAAAQQAAAHAELQERRHQQQPSQQQQQQLPPLSTAMQMMPPQSLPSMSQPILLSQQPVAVSMGMPLSGLPGMSQPLAALPMDLSSIPASTQPMGSDSSLQSAGNSPAHHQQQQQDCQSAFLLHQVQQQAQQQQYMRAMAQPPQQQQLAERVIPANAQVGRVQITYLDATQGSTCRLGTSDPINQVAFVAVLRAASSDELPSRYLSYKQPSRKTKRGSERFNASDIQVEVMYALVGCSDVGWSSRNITSDTRQFLQERYRIGTTTITNFYKNRSQRKPYMHPADGSSKRSRNGSSSGGAQRQAATGKAAAAKAVAAVPAADAAATRSESGTAAAAATRGMAQDYSMLTMATAPPAMAATPATPAATEQAMSTAEAAAAMAECDDGLQDGTYGGMEALGFRGLDSFCRQSSLPGLSASMSLPLPCVLDTDESYLGSDLDMTAAVMGMGAASDICCSPGGFSS